MNPSFERRPSAALDFQSRFYVCNSGVRKQSPLWTKVRVEGQSSRVGVRSQNDLLV